MYILSSYNCATVTVLQTQSLKCGCISIEVHSRNYSYIDFNLLRVNLGEAPTHISIIIV